MKVDVCAEYHWECSRCGSNERVPYSPNPGERLPKCQSCGKVDVVSSVSEAVHPEHRDAGTVP